METRYPKSRDKEPFLKWVEVGTHISSSRILDSAEEQPLGKPGVPVSTVEQTFAAPSGHQAQHDAGRHS